MQSGTTDEGLHTSLLIQVFFLQTSITIQGHKKTERKFHNHSYKLQENSDNHHKGM